MSEEWLNFIDGWFLTVVFYTLAVGLGIRMILFIATIIKSRINNGQSVLKDGIIALYLIAGAFIPFHKGLIKKPIYTALRYAFHACLFIVPIWYSGHINMIFESSLEWYWKPIPDEHIETMTFMVIGIGLFFATRRLLIPRVRKVSTISDFLIIIVTISPFITGYWYSYGTMDDVPILGYYMWYLHVFSGELMILMAVFLFVRTRLFSSTCVGCTSCAQACPTGTLEVRDKRAKRTFFYSHYQCICCGACVATCPEGAAALRHEVSLFHYLAFFRKSKIREKELSQCLGCNDLFAPDRQIENVREKIKISGIEMPQTLGYCTRCKKLLSQHKLAYVNRF